MDGWAFVASWVSWILYPQGRVFWFVVEKLFLPPELELIPGLAPGFLPLEAKEWTCGMTAGSLSVLRIVSDTLLPRNQSFNLHRPTCQERLVQSEWILLWSLYVKWSLQCPLPCYFKGGPRIRSTDTTWEMQNLWSHLSWFRICILINSLEIHAHIKVWEAQTQEDFYFGRSLLMEYELGSIF